MPWSTPTLTQVRSIVRDLIRGQLPGSDANVPNSVLRVLSDNQGALCHLVLQYIDWLALQLLPDTAETEWLDRHAYIWLVNADGSTGRKLATPAIGQATFTGSPNGTVIPLATRLTYGDTLAFETTEQIVASDVPTPAGIRALDPGVLGNLLPGTVLGVGSPPPGGDNTATVVSLDGGTDQETDDELRRRVLERIQQPPMGGDAEDYVRWTLAVSGVTRAWSYPLEMGIGTVTVRFMMDDLRADNDGFPLQQDIDAVTLYLDSARPVAVKDFFVEAPIPYPITLQIANLTPDTETTRAAVEDAVRTLLLTPNVAPGQELYASWVWQAIADAPGVDHFDLNFQNTPMPEPGYLPVLGTIIYS